jgi:hypothetical protein
MLIRSRLLLLGLLIGSLACDKVSKDVSPTQDEELVASDNELLTLPDSPLAVNLKALADTKTTTTFRLSRLPKSGEVSFTSKGLLLYAPDADFVAGADGFSVLSDAPVSGKTPPPVEFAVRVVSDADELPCGAGVTGDQTETNANTPVTIDVLRNDMFCEGKPNPASLQIETPPQHGSVRIDKGQVIYTPAKNFTGRERFIYRSCPLGGLEDDCIISVATITVNEVVRNCRVQLQNDQVSFRQRFSTDSLVIPVLANDQLCNSNKLLPITMTVKPTGGSAYINSKNTIVYKPQTNTTTDKIHYRRCAGPDCLDATVGITIVKPAATCVLKANYDLIKLVLSQPTSAMRRGIVPLYVLGNDNLCAPIRSMTLKQVPTGVRLQVLPSGIINYTMETPPKAKDITFTYELIDIQGKSSSATVKISIKP